MPLEESFNLSFNSRFFSNKKLQLGLTLKTRNDVKRIKLFSVVHALNEVLLLALSACTKSHFDKNKPEYGNMA